MAASDNAFYVAPANPLQALMAGVQGYQGGSQRAAEAEMKAGQAKAAQALQSGVPLQNVLAEVISTGNVKLADTIANFAQHQAAQGHRAAQLAESSRHSGVMEGIAQAGVEGGKVPPGFRRSATGGLEPIPGGPGDPVYKRTVTDRQNAPAGYKWKDANDPDAGLVAIPGGPGEKVDAEVAARIGLGKSFLGQLEDYTDTEGKPQKGLRSRLRAGETSGGVDAPSAWLGVGGPGEVRRIQDSGADALLRNLTGAGMSKTEADEYVRRYRFQIGDTPTTSLSKINQLERELRSVMGEVGRGRGGAGADGGGGKSAASGLPKIGEVRDGYRYKGGNPADENSWVRQGGK